MAVTIEWRRKPDKQHTGTAELNGVPGRPFIYVHPEDKGASGLGSCAGSWYYTHKDTTESSFTGNKSDIIVHGGMSYANYSAAHRLYNSLGWFTRAMLIGDYQNQEDPDEVFGVPLATSLQPSGQAAYDGVMRGLIRDQRPRQN